MDTELKINGHEFELFIAQDEIEDRIEEMARRFNTDLRPGVAMVPVMAGAFYFASRFLSYIDKPYRLFGVQASSYQGVNQSDEFLVSFLKNDQLIDGAHLVILEDVVDSGRTASELEKFFYSKGAAHVEVVALFYKPAQQQYECNLTHFGFEVGSEFIIGYGLDIDEEGRHLKDVYRKR